MKALALVALLTTTAAARPVRVPAGDYRLVLADARSEPVRHVPAFWLDRTTVTNRELLAFVLAHPEWRRDRVSRLVADDGYLAHWAAPDRLGARAPANAPAVDVSWFAARAFCAARGGRLPSEAEWELAAKDAPDDLAWYEAPTPDVLPSVHAGGALADLHGLVWEWIEDFAASPIGSDPGRSCGAGGGTGGDATAYATFLRFAFRGSLEAPFTTGSLGFRCAYDSPAPRPARIPAAPAHNSASLYDVPVRLVDASGLARGLDVARGHTVLVSMFYGSCAAACPALIDELARTTAGAPDARIVLVSFDPARDTPARLRELVRDHHLDARWTLAAARAPDARTLAALLDFRYRELAGGAFFHGIAVVALDGDGRVVGRARSLAEVAALRATLH